MRLERARNLAGAHRKYRAIDDAGGVWLFKPQSRDQTAIDVAAFQVTKEAGVPSPAVYPQRLLLGGQQYQGSIQPWLDRVIADELRRDFQGLSEEQLQDLQRHHVIDWLLANPDAHRGQFLVLADGSLIAVDKSQSLRFFPHDELQWNAYARLVNTRPPVYSYLFQAAKKGWVRLQPEVAIDFAYDLSARIDSHWLHQTWYPVVSQWSWVRLVYAAKPHLTHSEAVKLALDRIVRRKERLGREFENLYYRRSESLWHAP